jgi:hypothetical protein
MSYVERSAKKLLPILVELKKKMIPDKKNNLKIQKDKNKVLSDLEDDDVLVDLTK